MQEIEHENNDSTSTDTMLEIQMSQVTKFLKREFEGLTITSDFRKQFNRCLSLFVFYIQAHQTKKAYTKDDLISALYKTGLGSIGDKLSEWVIEDAKDKEEDDGKKQQQLNIVEQQDQENGQEFGNQDEHRMQEQINEHHVETVQ